MIFLRDSCPLQRLGGDLGVALRRIRQYKYTVKSSAKDYRVFAELLFVDFRHIWINCVEIARLCIILVA